MNTDAQGVSEQSESLPSLDPAAGQLLELEVSTIRPYDHNPRHGDNPEYQRIKASVRAQGLDQPLVVTQRPGESAYMLQAGGNTRLRILQELCAETGDQRFARVSCLYRPWMREMDVLLAHLRENDLRGDLSFLDKALAVSEARRLLEEEQGGRDITQTQLATTLRERGFALSQGLISQMAYTVDRLLPLLPAALKGGMGRPQVERIRQLERAAHSIWHQHSLDSEDDFEQAFAALCRRYDDPEWDISNLRRALEAEIAERAEISLHAVSITLDGYLLGNPGQSAAPEADGSSRPLAQQDESPRSTGGNEPASLRSESVMAVEDGVDSRVSEQSVQGASKATATESVDELESGSMEPTARVAGEGAGETLEQHKFSSRESPLDKMDLKSLRGRAWTLATRLAQRNALGELIQPLSGKGLGFILSDVPDPALVGQLDEDALAQVSMVWWHLAAASEMTVAPVGHLLSVLGQDSVLRRALEEQDAGLLFSSVWTLDPGHMGFRLWRRLDARTWKDLVDLMETYRAIHQAADNLREGLWQ
jgi:ParB family protein of integrating conjugative element (PFGI_1 class)